MSERAAVWTGAPGLGRTRDVPAGITARRIGAATAMTVALQRTVGNRAVSIMLARDPQPKLPALSPQEMWDRVLSERGMTTRVPPHGVNEADAKLAAAQEGLSHAQDELKHASDNPDLRDRSDKARYKAASTQRDRATAMVEKARQEVSNAQRAADSAHRNASEAPPSDPSHANTRQLGHGASTYAAVQVSDADGKQVAFGMARNDQLHAEEAALRAIQEQLTQQGIKPGSGTRNWKVTIVVDQSVCEERCRPALRKFAQDYGIALTDVVAHYPERASGEAVTPKTASKTAHHEPTRIASGPGEQILVGSEHPFRLQGGAPPPKPPAPPPSSPPKAPPTDPAPTSKSPGSSGTSATEGTPGVSASDVAAELAGAERSAWRWQKATSALKYGMQAWDIYAKIVEFARAENMAAATLADGTPYAALLKQGRDEVTRATGIQDYYAKLDVRTKFGAAYATPPEGWDQATFLLVRVQEPFVCIEMHLSDAMDDVQDAMKNIRHQIDEINDGMKDREEALIIPITSLEYADAYLFALAGGQVVADLAIALASYQDAMDAMHLQRQFARAEIKLLEQRIRAAGGQGFFFGIDDDDLASADLSKFSAAGYAVRPRCT